MSIRDTSKKLPLVDHDAVAEALGAERCGPVPRLDGAAAYMAALRADMAYMRSLGLSHEAIRQVVAEHDAGDISTSKLVELVRAAARVMAEDEVAAHRDALRALVDALPKCDCGGPATEHGWENDDYSCDIHAGNATPKLAHAEPLRRALALLGGKP